MNNDHKQGRSSYSRQGTNDVSSLVYGKVPPQALDLEDAVLGAILLEREAIDLATGIVSEDSFYLEANRAVWRAFISLQQKGSPIDLFTVTEELRRSGELESCGGAHHVTKLTQDVITSANLESHCKIVQEKYLQREMIRLGSQIVKDGYDPGIDVFHLMDYAEGAITEMATGSIQHHYMNTKQLAIRAQERYEMQKANPEALTGVPTGFGPLDSITRGWQANNLIIVAARPAIGKTAFALNLAINAAQHHSKPTAVGLFSLEMSADELTSRALACTGEISLDNILKGRMSEGEERTFQSANERWASMRIFIDDTPALNIQQLRSKSRRMKMRNEVGMIVIDYLQLMSGMQNARTDNREQEISKISRDLKALAKELEIPIIALSQLNRDGDGKEPELRHLRESGAIEQDADIVLFLYRPEAGKTEGEANPNFQNDAYIKIAKNRQGKVDRLMFFTDLSIQKWFDPDGWDNYKNPVFQPAHKAFTNREFGNSKVFLPGGFTGFTYPDSKDELPF